MLCWGTSLNSTEVFGTSERWLINGNVWKHHGDVRGPSSKVCIPLPGKGRVVKGVPRTRVKVAVIVLFDNSKRSNRNSEVQNFSQVTSETLAVKR